jgi:hypothetical protein
MKDEKKMLPTSKEKKSLPVSNPTKSKTKKEITHTDLDNIATSAVGNVKARSGKGAAGEGTLVSYEEER